MAASDFSGPVISYGQGLTSSGTNPDAGPSAAYQGMNILDPRYEYRPGSAKSFRPAFHAAATIVSADLVPQWKT